VRIGKSFAKHDDEVARSLAEVHRDEAQYISRVRAGLNEIERQFEEDREHRSQDVDKAWDANQLREETAKGDYSNIVPARDVG
jgi:hypothetical protein